MKTLCMDCGKRIKEKEYRYVIRQNDRVMYYGFERIHGNGSYLASRAAMMHGHYPAPRIVTPSGDFFIEEAAGTIEVLVIP